MPSATPSAIEPPASIVASTVLATTSTMSFQLGIRAFCVIFISFPSASLSTNGLVLSFLTTFPAAFAYPLALSRYVACLPALYPFAYSSFNAFSNSASSIADCLLSYSFSIALFSSSNLSFSFSNSDNFSSISFGISPL